MSDDESALMGGQTVADGADVDGQSMTVDDFTEVVSASVAARVSGMIGELSHRMDALEAGLQSSAGRLQVDGLSERLASVQATQDALSAKVDEATLQAEEIGPVIGEEIGPVLVNLLGQLLDLADSDSDGSSDVISVVSDVREQLQGISDVLVHPVMTTPFVDYTVVEGLLLLSLLFSLIKFWIWSLREGFSWLR